MNQTESAIKLDFHPGLLVKLIAKHSSDHANFTKKGIPAIYYFTGEHIDLHGPDDTAENINYDQMTKITRLAFHTAWNLANAEDLGIYKK